MRWLDAPRLSPDGLRVAYVETTLDEESDRTCHRIAICSVVGDAIVWLDMLDAGEASWSPQGDRIAVGGSGLWVATADDGAAHKIVSGEVAEPAWSPDGTRLAFTMRGPRGWRVHVVADDGNQLRELQASDESRQPQWSHDGRSVAFLTGDALWEAPTNESESAAPRRIDCPAEAVVAFAWSPDSSGIVCLGRRNRELVDVGHRLWVVATDDSSARELPAAGDATLGRSVRGDDPRGTARPVVRWSRATGRIYVESALHGRGPLVWFDAAGDYGFLLDGNHVCLSPSLSDSGRLATVVCGPDGPGDIWVSDEIGADPVRLTDVDIETIDLMAPTKHLRVEHDGVAVDAWLTGHRRNAPTPLVVNVHGGPYYAVGWRFTFEVQRLAARGAMVLTLNPRGSSGCGDEYAAAIRGDWGGVDAMDINAVIDLVAANPDIDDSRVAACGVSYGGWMVEWLLVNSDRFRTGVSENGISDFRELWLGSPDRHAFWALALGGPPSASDRYVERSPISGVAGITTPLLLVHAEEDDNVPISQSEQLAAALSLAGADVELVRLPAEGHLVNLIGRPSSRMRRAEAVDRWLDRTLFQ
jgi:dipeptidyl aminopeptidase/acylaminoacyl peptidase